jgi:hypothetical protein
MSVPFPPIKTTISVKPESNKMSNFFPTVSAANVLDKIEPHAKALEGCANAMEAAGIGGHSDGGHVALLRKMAADLRSQAAHGRMPYVYRDAGLHAADDVHAASESPAMIKAIQAMEAAGIEPPSGGKFASMDALDLQLSSVFDRAAPGYFEQRVSLKNAILKAGLVAEPEKRPDEGAIRYFANLMRKHKLEFDTKYMLTVPELDRLMASAKLDPGSRIEVKVAAQRAGVLDLENTAMAQPLPKPNIAVARSIFGSLDLDVKPGQLVSLATLNRALTEKGVDTRRRIEIKNALTACGALAA